MPPAQTYANKLCIESEEGVHISFVELREQCREVAAALLHRGIAPGDRVAIWAPNIHEWIIAALGIQYAGGVLVTINTRFKGTEAAQVLVDSGARWLFCIGQLLGQDYPAMLATEEIPALEDIIVLREHPGDHTGWSALIVEGADIPATDIDRAAAAVRADDTSDILFTSGTTGRPKGVMTGHEQNLTTFRHWSELIQLNADDRYLVINPFFHSFGYKAGFLAAIMRGATTLPHSLFDPDRILHRIAEDAITVMPGPPTLFQTILANPEYRSFDLSSLRKATTGAAIIPTGLIRSMREDLGIDNIMTAYGLTESCGVVTMCRREDDNETIATTSGRALPGVSVRCVNKQGEEVPTGEPGEVIFKGFNVMQGYFNLPEATAEAIDADGWLHTGDIGIMDECGNLHITDRLKDMFTVGGFNCYPAEVENILITHPDVNMAAVIGIPDARLGEVPMAWVIADEGLGEQQTIAWCRDHMANYKVPRKVVFVDEMPMNAAGKILKTELRLRAAEHQGATA